MTDPSPYVYDATVHRVVDGDTVYLKLTKTFEFPVDFGFRIMDVVKLEKTTVVNFRLLGIDTPEVVGSQKAEGLKATTELVRLLALGPLKVYTYKPDKYGRWLARIEVTVEDGTVVDVNEELLRGGFAKPYEGKGPR